MSAIDFYCSVDKVKGADGKDRVVITYDGKYLPYTEQVSLTYRTQSGKISLCTYLVRLFWLGNISWRFPGCTWYRMLTIAHKDYAYDKWANHIYRWVHQFLSATGCKLLVLGCCVCMSNMNIWCTLTMCQTRTYVLITQNSSSLPKQFSWDSFILVSSDCLKVTSLNCAVSTEIWGNAIKTEEIRKRMREHKFNELICFGDLFIDSIISKTLVCITVFAQSINDSMISICHVYAPGETLSIWAAMI